MTAPTKELWTRFPERPCVAVPTKTAKSSQEKNPTILSSLPTAHSQLPVDSTIIEGIVTTLNLDGELNIAPMGPIVDPGMQTLILRPFQTSTTYANLKARPFGIFHVVDDVLLISQAALDRLQNLPPTFDANQVQGRVLADSCRWYEFEVTNFDDLNLRTRLTATVVHVGRNRDFFGFNRAKHAVLEATILATRLHLLPVSDVRQQLAALASPVEKTAGPRERAAFDLVNSYVDEWYQTQNSGGRPH
jgi:hypothetical protein